MRTTTAGQTELWASLMRGQALLADAVSDRLEAEAGIPLAWYEVLAALAEAPEGALRMQDLGQSMWLSKSGLTRLCDRIEEAGYLSRQSCPTDRRGTFAVITDVGHAKVRDARPVFARASEDLFLQHLSARERDVLRSAMNKIIGANGPQLRAQEPAVEQPRAMRKHTK
ncbi:MAG TPA: MarR family transcriptional regulator [Actinomycetota bacterium]|nr:MarR family transcriptional regulator [Actinomycetota bacterium]